MTDRNRSMSHADSAILSEAFQSAVAMLEEMCLISSASDEPEGLGRMAHHLAEKLTARGMEVELRQASSDDAGVPLPVLDARAPGGSADREVLLVGHMDTVLPAIPPRRRDDWLHGTGALDMKGGLVLFLATLDVLQACGLGVPQGLRLIVVPDEEVGGGISEHEVRSAGSRADVLLVLEPGERLRDSRETIVMGRRGLLEWRLTVEGRSEHSGLAFWQGRSALIGAAEFCTSAYELSEPERGPVVNPARLVAGSEELVQHPDRLRNTLGTRHLLNVVPDRALAEGELRYLDSADEDRVVGNLLELGREIESTRGVLVQLEFAGKIAPVAPSNATIAMARDLVGRAAAEGWDLVLERDRGGVSFSNFLPDPSRVTVLDGLGPVGVGMHTREEAVDLRSLRRRIPLLTDLLAEALSS